MLSSKDRDSFGQPALLADILECEEIGTVTEFWAFDNSHRHCASIDGQNMEVFLFRTNLRPYKRTAKPRLQLSPRIPG